MKQSYVATYRKEKSIARGGRLCVENECVKFRPHFVDRLLFAKELAIPTSQIEGAKFVDTNMFGNEEFVIHMKEGISHKFLVRDSSPIIDGINRLILIDDDKFSAKNVAIQEHVNKTNSWAHYIFSIVSLYPIISFMFFFFGFIIKAVFSSSALKAYVYQNITHLTFAAFVLAALMVISIVQIVNLNMSRKARLSHCLYIIVLGLLYVPLFQIFILSRLRKIFN